MSVRRWRIRGEVQGVGFRWFAQRAARATGVASGVGGVRNEDDSSVCAVAEGGTEALDRLGAELARGPRHGRVAEVECEDLAAVPAGERFDLEF